MAYPRRLLTENESVVREFRPHWRLLFFPFLWAVLFTAAIVATWVVRPDVPTFDWAVTGVAIIGLMRFSIYPFVSWWFTHYILTNHRLIRRGGIIARAGKEIPLENINDLSFSQNPLERVLRAGDLLIESAGEQGQERFADIPDPEAFQSLVYKVREIRSKEMSSGHGAESTDAASVLERFGSLLKEGLITREEYDRKKQEILGSSEPPAAG
ncbi:MAG TPA: PH domain-containing protein [Acidimicrobiia bacterium]|nr:PH domain-containing protein [Acidimicrobiia bacterium]